MLFVEDKSSLSFYCSRLRRSRMPHKVGHHHLGYLRYAGTRPAARAQGRQFASHSYLELQIHCFMQFLEPAAAPPRPASAEGQTCLIWHWRNQRSMHL